MMQRVVRALRSNTTPSIRRISSITTAISNHRKELPSLQQSLSIPEIQLPPCHLSRAKVLNSKGCFPVNHLVPPSPCIEHSFQFQSMTSANTSLLRAFRLWMTHHQLNDVSLHNVSSLSEEYKTSSTRYSQSPFPCSGPPADLACYSRAKVLNSKGCSPVNHLVPPSPCIEHSFQFQSMTSANTSLLRAFRLWMTHHQLNDVSLHNLSSLSEEYKTSSTRYSQSPFPCSGPPADLACYVARAFLVQHAIAKCPIFSYFFSYSPAEPSTPVWTTCHARNMSAVPASLFWVNSFTVPLNTLHDGFYTLNNPAPS